MCLLKPPVWNHPVAGQEITALLSGVGRRQARAAAQELLRWLGVAAEGTPTGSAVRRRETAHGGARALITGPPVLLADEPTGALDHRARTAVAEFLFSVPRERGSALVVVTHDAAGGARLLSDQRV